MRLLAFLENLIGFHSKAQAHFPHTFLIKFNNLSLKGFEVPFQTFLTTKNFSYLIMKTAMSNRKSFNHFNNPLRMKTFYFFLISTSQWHIRTFHFKLSSTKLLYVNMGRSEWKRRKETSRKHQKNETRKIFSITQIASKRDRNFTQSKVLYFREWERIAHYGFWWSNVLSSTLQYLIRFGVTQRKKK